MPEPMIEPMPIRIRLTGPSARRSWWASAMTESGWVSAVRSASAMAAPPFPGRGSCWTLFHELPTGRLGVANAVEEVDRQAEGGPNREPHPSIPGQPRHHRPASQDSQRRHDPHERRSERPLRMGMGPAQDHDAEAYDDEGRERANRNQFAQDIQRHDGGKNGSKGAGQNGAGELVS